MHRRSLLTFVTLAALCTVAWDRGITAERP